MTPSEICRLLSQQWPCRELQIKSLASLLSPGISSPPTLVVHGVSATCKSTIVQAVLSTLEVPYAVVRSAECITSRHLLTKVLWATLESIGLRDEWERFSKGRCEHVNTLAALLAECLVSTVEKFILVLDGVDMQREAPHTLLSAVARLGETIPSLTIILILGSTPRPLFLQTAAVPHIYFSPYTREESITIILSSDPPSAGDLPAKISAKLYAHFVSTVYDSLAGPTASTIPAFRSICEKLWPQFVAPLVNGDMLLDGSKDWDFARLLVRSRALFRYQGETALVHHIIPERPNAVHGLSANTKSSQLAVHTSSLVPSLPYLSALVLTAAYLASHTPQRLDTIFFSKFSSSSLSARSKRAHHRRRLKVLSQAQSDGGKAVDEGSSAPGKRPRRQRTRITKSTLESALATSCTTVCTPGNSASGLAGKPTILSARPFPLERLLAIYHAIDPNPPLNSAHVAAASDAVYAELATLRRLRLVVPAGGRSGLAWPGPLGGGSTVTVDPGEKWCVNVPGDWVVHMAKRIGVEAEEWLTGGLD